MRPESVDAPRAAADPPRWIRRPVMWLAGWLAVASTGLLLAATFGLPVLWVGIDPASRSPAFWVDLWDPGSIAYERRLLGMPIVSAVLAAVGGMGLVAGAHRRAPSPWVVSVSAWSVAFAGIVAMVYGARWAGFGLARMMEGGPAPLALGSQVFCILGFGVASLIGSACLLLRGAWGMNGVRPVWPLGSVAAGAAGLAFSPLVPWARMPMWAGAVLYVDEHTLAVLAGQDDAALGAAVAVTAARVLVWAALGLCAASSVWFTRSPLRAGTRAESLVLAVLAILWILVGVAAVRVWLGVGGLQEPSSRIPNPFLILAAITGLALVATRLRVLFLARPSRHFPPEQSP